MTYSIGKTFNRPLRALALAAALLVSMLAGAEVTITDDVIREYKVINLEPPSENSVKVDANLGTTIGSTSRLVQTEFEGKPVYVLEREEFTAKGARFPWKIYMDPVDMSVFRIEKKGVSHTGKTVFEHWIDYRDPAYDHPRPLAHIYTITMLVMTKEIKAGDRYDMFMITGEDSAPWHMFIDVKDEERIKVPAGEFDCFRVMLEPDYDHIMGKWSWTAPLVKRFVPEYTFWMMKDSPHAMVRFQGTMGPVGGSPPQAHELVSVRPAP